MLKRILVTLLYIVLGIVIVFLWLVVDYAFRSGDEQLLLIIRIVGIASFLVVVLINGIKYLRSVLNER